MPPKCSDHLAAFTRNAVIVAVNLTVPVPGLPMPKTKSRLFFLDLNLPHPRFTDPWLRFTRSTGIAEAKITKLLTAASRLLPSHSGVLKPCGPGFMQCVRVCVSLGVYYRSSLRYLYSFMFGA